MTLGLAQITNDAQATIQMLEKYGQYFDRWFITVADKDKKQYEILKKLKDAKLQLNYFKWVDDFSEARNSNLDKIDTDYWFWMDTDDDLIEPENLQKLVSYMDKADIDVIQLKYDYAQDKGGEGVSDHWRERIIRTSYNGRWHAPVHETLQGPPALVEKSDLVVVKHNKPDSLSKPAMLRNEKILIKHYTKTKDPRDAQYLGMTEVSKENLDKAISWFLRHIETSGSPHDIYRSWCRIAECEWRRQKFDQALYATDEAIKLLPEFPDAYHIKVMIYTNMEEYNKGIEWLKVAIAKPIPETLTVTDPTLYKFRGLGMGAMCYLFSGRVKEAHALYREVKEVAPHFFKDLSGYDGLDWDELFESAYTDQKAVDYTRYLLYYTGANGGKPLDLFKAIPPKLFADPRLNADRVKFLPKTKWDKGSIAYYCGHSTETWGPDTLEKGMGGSEEAVVYLSRELAKHGHKVTVYNDREEEYDDGPLYKPWTLLNPGDDFDVFVAWRVPELLRGVKARVKICDLHDTVQPERVYQAAKLDPEALFFVKSQYHRSLYPELGDERFVVVGNAIVEEHFS